MLIVCPSCASEYTIGPEKLGADGRTVRCAICRDTWFAAPDGVRAELPVADDPAPGAVLLPGAPPKPVRPRKALHRRLLPLAAALTLAAGIWSALETLSPKAGLAAAREAVLGTRGAEFRNVLSEVIGPESRRMLVVTGEVANTTLHPIDLRPLEFLVRNGEEQVLATWTSAPPRPTLPPGEAARFEAHFAAPPAEGRDVRVQFTKADSVAFASRSPF